MAVLRLSTVEIRDSLIEPEKHPLKLRARAARAAVAPEVANQEQEQESGITLPQLPEVPEMVAAVFQQFTELVNDLNWKIHSLEKRMENLEEYSEEVSEFILSERTSEAK